MDLSFLNDALRAVSEGLLYPVIVGLLLGLAYALFTLGSAIVEFVVERRHFKLVLPDLQHKIDQAEPQEMTEAVKGSGLLLSQKKALLTLFANRDLPEESRWALAKKLLASEAASDRKKVGRNDAVAKVAPMLGLMGTLIPLGPGIVALSENNVEVLSSALLTAFDTTVAGLVVGAVCFLVSRVRRQWYSEYNEALEAAVTTMLEKMDGLEKAAGGRLTVERGSDGSGSEAPQTSAADKSKERS